MHPITTSSGRGLRVVAIGAVLAMAMAAWVARPAAAAAAAPTWPIVTRGHRGYDVSTAQYLLRHHGHSLVADGIFGPITERTVRAFQSARRLRVDGIIGPQTWSALVVPAGRGTPPGDLVKALQTVLVSNQEGPLVIDGIFGPKTEAATRSAERHIGGTVNGILSEPEWQNLIWRRAD